MGEYDRELGQISSLLQTMHGDIREVKSDVRCLTEHKAQTEERLKQGVKHFEELDERLEKQEARKCPTVPEYSGPKGTVVYWLIAAGLTVISLTLAIFK